MALSSVRALLTAKARGAWNRTRRESGASGAVGTAVILGIAGLILIAPGVISFRAGFELGRQLRSASEPQSLTYWCWLQALFTMLFALLGGFRHRLSFPQREIGIFPVPGLSLLAAELPASLIEVFPLLGAQGILCSNLGLALAVPKVAPAIAVLACQGLAWMLLVQHLAGSVKRFFFKRPAIVLAGASLAVAAAVLALAHTEGDPRSVLRGAVEMTMLHLPGSAGYHGVWKLSAGRVGTGLGGVGIALAATLLLLALTAGVHTRELATEAALPLRSRSGPPPLSFKRGEVGLARLFERQLLSSRIGQILLLAPLICGACLALSLKAVEALLHEGAALPGFMASIVHQLTRLPLFELLLFLTLWLSADIWMNQFGWDRRGVRTLLVLPLSIDQILTGKLLGMARFTLLQALLAALPLLVVYRPPPVEILSALGGIGALFMVAVAAGHLFSVRFPRDVERTGGGTMPVAHSGFLFVFMAAVGLALAGLQSLAAAIAWWAPAVVLPALLAAAIAGYRKLLPALARLVAREQERLLLI